MTIAIKKAKEKEIKTAYDGLVLQVWQLEKKIESLEKKIKEEGKLNKKAKSM
ncbi:hypothetical protein RO3G_13642 [Rhizopus delemar RA 99-880]|uniref:Uncharacterized protein n=1 Tax=Rhizopus delemar (strain RA 99-880 / ATCC MYA-4621 / FGSC 9543 / NRRL 43880) TaxID=246409 RepID=I1CKF1_RHIO9|nr:hypothetical protein RO3G_13642 [Rhizopus delemar RA 99-880]|eukprot:EIE88931.1 hypothetical protein RO3G_13642 [Rhizopus delemar RA 99-880]